MNFNLLIPPTASPRPQSRSGPSRALGGAISRQSVNPGGFGPPGAGVGPDQVNINGIFKDRFANMTTAKAQIERQREQDAAIDRLTKEFETIDINRDGTISLEEIQGYLQKKVSPFQLITYRVVMVNLSQQ